MKELKYQVLTTSRRIKRGDYTYSLIDGYLHINNHKTNDRSIIVPAEHVKELFNK